MSVATEFPPSVFIPERARAARPAGTVASRPRLRLVPPAPGCAPVPDHRSGSARPGAVRVTSRRAKVFVLAGNLSEVPATGIGTGQFSTQPLRLTRRGLVAVAIGVAALGGLMLLVAHLSMGSAAGRTGLAPAAVVTVQPGDTLWSIAGQVAPGRDPRGVVEQLRRSNRLGTVALTPGQTLKVG